MAKDKYLSETITALQNLVNACWTLEGAIDEELVDAIVEAKQVLSRRDNLC